MRTNGRVSNKATKVPTFVSRAERAMRRAAQNVKTQNRAFNLPLLVWKDKKVTPRKEIVAAIKNKSVLHFVYDGKDRIVEPQTYGISRTGREVLRARQIGGGSQSGQARIAKLFDVERISKLKKTGEHFFQALPEHNPKDSAMVKVFASLPVPSANG